MATVAKKGKRWYAIFNDAAGKQKWKAGYYDKGETVALARRLEDEARAVRLGDVDPQAEARRVERARPADAHLQDFRASMEANARSPKHIAYTIRDVQLCLDFTGIDNANKLTRPLMDRWRKHCLAVGYPDWHYPDKGPVRDSRKTVNRRIASVRAWLWYLHEIGAVDRVILENYKMLETAGHQTFNRRALSRDEVAALLEKTPDPHRREIYRFAAYTGFRRSEIASMTPARFDFPRKTVTVRAIDAKRKNEDQTLPMHSTLVEPLRKLCEAKQPDEPVFHLPTERHAVRLLYADCAAAGVSTADVDFHALRHTFCSLLASENIRPDVLMKLARHKQLATTLKYYVHFTHDDERSALERL